MFLRSTLATLVVLSSSVVYAADEVIFRDGEQQRTIQGEVQITAQDGGLLLLGGDGRLWSVEPQNLVRHEVIDAPFRAMSKETLARQLLTELPPGFEIHTTAHYLIAHNTSRAYAQWVGALYERLYSAFTNYWEHRGFRLQEPRVPLVAIVFSDKQSYSQHVKDELGDAADVIVGFYSLQTNRVNMYDLTGVEAARQSGDRRSSSAQINRVLARPEAEPMVATIIHEATHQIAFNCGLQQRFAAVPVWLSEGMAIYFESPDLGSSKGWRTIGAVHRSRLAQFRRYLQSRPGDSLLSLLADDQRIRNARTGPDAYAEAWALNYFLIRQRPKEYVAYLKIMADKKPLITDTPEERLRDFRAAFGEDLNLLESEFLRYIERIR